MLSMRTAKLFNSTNSTTYSFGPTGEMKCVSVTVAGVFPLLVLLQCALFYVLPLFVPFITGTAIAVYGVVLTAIALWRLFSRKGKAQALVVGILMATWLCWAFVPTRDFSVHVRFWLERDKYEQAVAETYGGAQPRCLAKHECMSDGNTPPYLVFPFPGFLTGWVGIVHVPESSQAPSIERLKSVAAGAGCDPSPISPHYYVCGFY
jgi:hypothetical protein